VSEVNQALSKFYERRFVERSVTGDRPEMVWLVENIPRELDISKSDEVLDCARRRLMLSDRKVK